MSVPNHPVVIVDGWTFWWGGKCPVNPDDLVDVRYRRPGRAPSIEAPTGLAARHYEWRQVGLSTDIIAYRVVTLPETAIPAKCDRRRKPID